MTKQRVAIVWKPGLGPSPPAGDGDDSDWEQAPREDRSEVNIPTSVYKLYDADGRLLYVGVTRHGYRRLNQHAKEKPWWSEVVKAEFEHLPDTRSAFAREAVLIRTASPAYNIAQPRPVAPARRGAPRRVNEGMKRPAVRQSARKATSLHPREEADLLDRQTRRIFGMSRVEFYRALRTGEIRKTDERLRLVANLLDHA